ncbi:MAG: IS5 family transposase, partial [Halioglobus sp.]
MRQSLEQQMFFGEVDISKVQISTKSRDDIPQVLLGLQHIYQKQSLRDQVFK